MEPVMFTPEKLEDRRLLSVSVDFNLKTGHLDVVGLGKSSEIRVTMVETEAVTKGTVRAPRPTLQTLQTDRPGPLLRGVSVYDGLNLVFNSLGTRARVTHVDIYGTLGKDEVTTYGWNSQVSSRFFGSDSADTVWATAANASLTEVFGEDGDDTINLIFSDRSQYAGPDGGAGNDVIDVFGSVLYDPFPTTSPGSDFSINCDVRPRLILGGEGNDVISAELLFGGVEAFGYYVMAGAGDDVITGSGQADQLYGEDGNDLIEAGAGNDYLNGGLGDDWICGDDGDDFLDHGGGKDVIEGGDGFDRAIAGKEDDLIDIEELM
jgi:Ca2+-binding RTX toxin-like protein